MFLTGEFSKLSRVSKRLLYYYDEIGLLKPAHTDPDTGYRYYSARQLPRLDRILALKELGLSLEQITHMLHETVSDEEQALLEDLQRLRQIEARIEHNRNHDQSPDVLLKSVPAQPFLSTRDVFPDMQSILKLVQYLQHESLDGINRRLLGALTAVIHTEDFRMTDNDVELGYLLESPIEGPIPLGADYVLHLTTLPAVQTMASAVQIGGPDLAFVALGKMARWIEANGYRIAGPYREIGIEIPDMENIDDSVVEIQLPVEKPAQTDSLMNRSINPGA